MPPKPKNPGKFPALLLFLATVIPAFGQMETNKIFFARAETEFLAAQKIFELNTCTLHPVAPGRYVGREGFEPPYS